MLEHFGKPVAGSRFDAGRAFQMPWPVDQVYRYRTGPDPDVRRRLHAGRAKRKPSDDFVERRHTEEVNFLVGNRAAETITNSNRRHQRPLKVPPVSLITVSIPVQFQITNVLDWAYQNADPTNLLQDLATRAVVHYLAGVDLNEVLSQARVEAAPAVA